MGKTDIHLLFKYLLHITRSQLGPNSPHTLCTCTVDVCTHSYSNNKKVQLITTQDCDLQKLPPQNRIVQIYTCTQQTTHILYTQHQMHMHTFMYAHAHTLMYAHAHTLMYAHAHTQHTHTHTHACTHAHTHHMHTHTHIHTHTHTYTHIACHSLHVCDNHTNQYHKPQRKIKIP